MSIMDRRVHFLIRLFPGGHDDAVFLGNGAPTPALRMKFSPAVIPGVGGEVEAC